MYRPLEAFIGLRYLLPRRRNLYVSFISGISLLGIAVGVSALIIVLSVMNGFGNELRARLLSLTAHVTVSSPDPLPDPLTVVTSALTGLKGVTEIVPYVDGQGLVVDGLNLSGVRLRGVDPADGLSTLAGAVDPGVLQSLQPGSNRVVLGAELARNLLVMPGDSITLMIPRATAGGRLSPLLKRFNVSGTFEVGLAEHDTSTALLNIEDAALLLGLEAGRISGIRISLQDIFDAPGVAHELQQRLGEGFAVGNWTREQASIYRATRIEKAMMFVILLLIVAVAAFNIVASLVMAVADRRTDIAILRTLGMRPAEVMRVFVVQGSVIGLLGTTLGLVCGVVAALNIESLLAWFETSTGASLIPRDVYYITSVPSDLRWGEVAVIAGVALLLSVIATLYPARRAAATHPAEALRYE